MGTAAQLTFLLAQFSPARGVSSLFNLYENTHRRAQKLVSHDSKPRQTDKQVKDHWPCPWVEQGPIGGTPGLQGQYLQSRGAGWREETWPRTGHPCCPSYQAALLCSGPSQKADIFTGRTKHF